MTPAKWRIRNSVFDNSTVDGCFSGHSRDSSLRQSPSMFQTRGMMATSHATTLQEKLCGTFVAVKVHFQAGVEDRFTVHQSDGSRSQTSAGTMMSKCFCDTSEGVPLPKFSTRLDRTVPERCTNPRGQAWLAFRSLKKRRMTRACLQIAVGCETTQRATSDRSREIKIKWSHRCWVVPGTADVFENENG